jgi:polysaccharide export outer membrane protein
MLRSLVSLFIVLLAATAAMAQSSYRIQPGDVLLIEVVEDPALNRSELVLPDGSISFPVVGSLQVGGKSVDQVRDELTAGIAGDFASPPRVVVSVRSLGQRAPVVTGGVATAPLPPPTISVYIIGEAASPGKKAVAPGTTLLQFLAEAGGFTKFAATKRIQLRRIDASTGTERIYGFNFRAVQTGKASPQSIVLAPGDVIVVPERRLFE